jgi:hypothetical protein
VQRLQQAHPMRRPILRAGRFHHQAVHHVVSKPAAQFNGQPVQALVANPQRFRYQVDQQGGRALLLERNGGQRVL